MFSISGDAERHVKGKHALEANIPILSNEELVIAASLIGAGQSHLFEAWPAPGIHDDDKRRLLDQAAVLDAGWERIRDDG